MKNKVSLMGALLLVLFLGPATAGLACDAAGPNKHIGNVMSVDPVDGSFVIRDAQSMEPMKFKAEAGLLNGLEVRQQVTVTYKEENGKMTAVEIKS